MASNLHREYTPQALLPTTHLSTRSVMNLHHLLPPASSSLRLPAVFGFLLSLASWCLRLPALLPAASCNFQVPAASGFPLVSPSSCLWHPAPCRLVQPLASCYRRRSAICDFLLPPASCFLWLPVTASFLLPAALCYL